MIADVFLVLGSNVSGVAADESVVTSMFDPDTNSAILSLAGKDQHGRREQLPCTVCGLVGKRLRLQSKQRLALSVAASVEHDDAMFLGEVMSCTSLPSGYWQVELQVEQMLTGLQSLLALRSRLLGETGESRRAGERNDLRAAA